MASRKPKKQKALEATMSQTARKVIAGTGDVVLVAGTVMFAVFCYLALAGYNPEDPGFFSVTRSADPASIRNYGGIVGARLAGALVDWFGAAAWLIPLVFARLTWVRLQGARYRTVGLQLLAGAGLVVVVAAALSIAIGGAQQLGPYRLAGGWFGQLIGVQFFWRFFSWGSWVFLVTLFLVLFVAVGGTPVIKKHVQVSRASWRGGKIAWNNLRVRWARWRRERRFQRDQAKESKEQARLAASGVGAEIPEDMPMYQDGGDATQPASAPEKDATNTPEATPKESTLPQFVAGQDRADPPDFDSLSLDMGSVAAPSAQGAGAPKAGPRKKGAKADQTAPEFTVIRNKGQGEKPATPSKEKQIAMPMQAGTEYTLPSIALLDEIAGSQKDSEDAVYKAQAQILEQKLKDFGVKGTVEKAHAGPVITVFEFRLAPGTRVNQLTKLEDDLALAMATQSVRISRFPNRDVMGIEIPSDQRDIVSMREVLQSESFKRRNVNLPFALGKTVFGECVSTDLSKMPHLLMGGATGSGKSVGINTLLLSLLYTRTPEELKLFMIDPKMLEMSKYNDIPHLGYPVVTDARKAVALLRMLVRIMEERYTMMMEAGARNITGYNDRIRKGTIDREKFKVMPYIVCVVDELADLMMVARKDVEEPIARLAQMARAAGIHLVLATQRPSVDVVTGLIKANFPARIAFKVTSRVDSKTILDQIGAQNLLGKGDMLFLDPSEGSIGRIHGCFVSDDEVEHICDFWRDQGTPQNLFDENDLAQLEEKEESAASGGNVDAPGGDIYEQAVAVAVREGEISVSRLQRVLGIGYNRAAKLLDQMDSEGILGPKESGGKRRKVLLQQHELVSREGDNGPADA